MEYEGAGARSNAYKKCVKTCDKKYPYGHVKAGKKAPAKAKKAPKAKKPRQANQWAMFLQEAYHAFGKQIPLRVLMQNAYIKDLYQQWKNGDYGNVTPYDLIRNEEEADYLGSLPTNVEIPEGPLPYPDINEEEVEEQFERPYFAPASEEEEIFGGPDEDTGPLQPFYPGQAAQTGPIRNPFGAPPPIVLRTQTRKLIFDDF